MGVLLEEGFRYSNQHVVFRTIRESGMITRRQLMQQTDLSFQTVSNIVAELIDTELVMSDGLVNQNAGKRAESLKVNPDGLFAIGVLLDRARIEIALVDLLGAVRSFRELNFAPSHPDAIMEDISAVTQEMLHDFAIPEERFAGIGLCTPGPIDFRSGALSRPPDFPHWTFVPIRPRLEEMTGYPVTLLKDSHAAALAELWTLHNAAPSSFFYLYFSTGIGGALVVNRNIWTGFSGNAGEVGHVRVADSPVCDCGAVGCLEAVWSLNRLARQTNQTVAELVDSLEADHSPYRDQWMAGVPLLARVVVASVNIIEPEWVILGGPYGQRISASLLTFLNEALQREGFVRNLRPLTVRSATSRNAACLGAAMMRINDSLTHRTNVDSMVGLNI
ncbi:MAG: hypothetical protein C7B46_13655 [Sulfobacillus benefaciens]|uniref:ROK family transcriptional regulator n=1 Tax=Sulfobacillus benefaciens TaxID=453960 RepID=A0A2T2XDS4_9FIRM|nr:MAG: hypothetical protein C7B46_13655 [Sulfobacillus benefaciens]